MRVALERLRRAAEIAATAIFAAIFVIFLLAIAMRYGLNRPLAWTDEINVVLLIWMMFLAAAFVLRDREHVAFDIVWSAAPPAGRRAMAVLATVGVGGLFLAALPGTYGYVTFLWRERTSVLELRLDYVYFCFVIFMVSMVARYATALMRLLGRHWRVEVGD